MVAVKGHFVVYQHKNIYEENERAGGRNDVMRVGPGSEVYASKQTCVALLKLWQFVFCDHFQHIRLDMDGMSGS